MNSIVYDSVFKPKLYSNMCVPSTVHAYSLGIEYMRNWILSKFDDDGTGDSFFKVIYINGQHLFSDFSRFNNGVDVKKGKPMLAIMPSIDTEFDRDSLDTYTASDNILVGKNNYNRSFIEDRDLNVYMGLGSELMVMNFTFRIRVETKSNQLDLWKYLQMKLRIGATQGDYLDLDFHIPISLIYGIAELAHFEIVYDENNKPVRIKDIYSFLSYLNKNSKLPILYKLRAINGNSEFFIRVPQCYMHIACNDKIQLDDGDIEGQVTSNYHLDFSCVLRMPIPKYYYLYTGERIKNYIQMQEMADIGIYNLRHTDAPEKNAKGWDQCYNTEYMEDNYPYTYPYKISIKSLLENKEMSLVIDDCINLGLSPDIFIDVVVYNAGNVILTQMNWDTRDIIINHPFKHLIFYIAIYADLKYVNESLTNIKKMKDKRFSL